MQTFLGVVGIIAYLAALALGGSKAVVSDIQLILMAVLLLGGTTLFGLAAIIGRLQKTQRD